MAIGGSRRGCRRAALPFVIEWAPGTPLPGRARIAPRHRRGRHCASTRERRSRLHQELARHAVPIDIRRGTSAITAVVLRSASGDEICLDTES